MTEIDLLHYEKELWSQGYSNVSGIDEVGRGPIAGPVVASAVSFQSNFIQKTYNTIFKKINDSKKLNQKLRKYFYELLINCEYVNIGTDFVDSVQIDKINILKSTHLVMKNAACKINTDFILIDGLPVKDLPCASRNIIKGDTLSISIAAASIIAKVKRDEWMIEIDKIYPQYGFARHKGYGTKEHMDAINKYGPTPIHRYSFQPISKFI